MPEGIIVGRGALNEKTPEARFVYPSRDMPFGFDVDLIAVSFLVFLQGIHLIDYKKDVAVSLY